MQDQQNIEQEIQEELAELNEPRLSKKQRQRYKKKLRKLKLKEETEQKEKVRQRSLEESRTMFRAKLEEKKIERSSKATKEHVLEKTLKHIGIDKEKFKSDLKAVQKEGGLEINMKI